MLDDCTPTVQDIHGDTNIRSTGLHDDRHAEHDQAEQLRALMAQQQPTDDELEAEYRRQCIAGKAEWTPLPTLKPIASKVRQLNPAAWR